jgi:galactokinase/mevalonate kinase-like predicted kinase
MNPGSPVCLQLWYHMYGKHIGTLNIISKTAHVERTVLTIEGNKGDRWLFAQVGMNLTEIFEVCD